MSSATLISAADVCYRYLGSDTPIGPFSYAVDRGEFHVISGASGCGKSTFARILSGVIPHLYRGRLQGRVLIDGRPTDRVPLWHLSSQVGLVSQNPAAQVFAATVEEEIRFGLENLGLTDADIERRLHAALDSAGLQALADRDPRTLSGGEQQLLVIAAIMARQPQAIVLDEPLSMLDSASARRIVDHLQALRRDGTAVVAFEHRTAAFADVACVRHLHLDAAPTDVDDVPACEALVPAFRLALSGLGVQLGGQQVLHDIDLTMTGGQVVAVVGPVGAGKTTLLRALVGLQSHTGQRTWLSDSRQTPRLALCFQNPDRQFFTPTVREEIRYGLPHCDEGFYQNVLALLGLAQHEDHPPLLLSEGEKKRLGLAVALLRPGLCGICLDEPTLGQDDRHRRRIGAIVRRLAAAGYLCVVATHDVEWALRWCDHMVALRAGQVVGSGAPQMVRNRHDLWSRTDLLVPQPLASSCVATAHSH